MDSHGRLVPIAIILRRDLARAAAHLRDELSAFVPLVSIIIDRRYGDRRHTGTGCPVERRQAGRRQRNLAKQLTDNGWAVVTGDFTSNKEHRDAENALTRRPHGPSPVRPAD